MGFTKNQYIGRGLPKKGAGLGQLADLRELGKKKGGVVFLRRG